MTDQQISQGAGPTPVTLTVQGNEQLLPKLAFAAYDGTGAAGNFLPVVRFIGPGGQVAGQAVGDVVTAGASVDQTWFRGLAQQTGGSTGTVAREILQSNTAVTIPSPGTAFLPWDKVSGVDLLDLTNPLKPTVITSGVYGIAVTATSSTSLTVGATFRLQIGANVGGGGINVVNNSGPSNAIDQAPTVACTYVCEIFAGRFIDAIVYNFDSIAQDFGIFQAVVQRIS